ncbi:phosphatidate cytidylyltransferase [Brevibacterium sp. 50QC2O2]|uniref:phosphatidate cytidylyltransferase n=1 Tax=Brevibacterium TaxID=1696 RepID=UPI00211CFBD1|nr:phosphatidate cytidylyltransferase [Brevibacterium sp. 91QC2O2]MCQ9384934.1 phosphatidate cytidylyltransferase [Brevibacterium sp. 68QC2CO]MCQ9388019.1 phosphatidate cytidylyltransferase [Brevibacterium sp. 50QC2O2]
MSQDGAAAQVPPGFDPEDTRTAEHPLVEPPEAKDYGKAGRNLPAAIGVGVVLGGIVILSLVIWPPLFLIVVVIGVGASLWELSDALSKSGSQVLRWPTIGVGVLMVLAAYFGGREALWAVFTVGSGLIMWIILVRNCANPVKDFCLNLFALTYVGLMASFVVYLLAQDHGNAMVATFLALCVSSDTGGYVFGVLMGRHPIAPSISPKKSWEGYLGSTVFAVGVGICLAVLLVQAPWWTGLVLGLVVPAFATLGDFSESMIKRDLGLKDMGTLLPGHGGVMDRLDSILPTAPVALALFSFLPGFLNG